MDAFQVKATDEEVTVPTVKLVGTVGAWVSPPPLSEAVTLRLILGEESLFPPSFALTIILYVLPSTKPVIFADVPVTVVIN